MQSSLNLTEIFKPIRESLPNLDAMLGKTAMMPFECTNSGARKLLFSTQREHVIPVREAEVAYIQTGAEDEFGRYSSSLDRTNGKYQLVAKIPKYSNLPEHHYIAIFIDHDNNVIEMKERKCYNHNSESYGFMINNDAIDQLVPNQVIPKGTLLSKSECFHSKYNNRKDGLNLLTGYISSAKTIEDGILISESTQKKFVTPLVHTVSIMANDNDIPLNLFGYNDSYKIMPNIMEEIPEGILMALRREDKEEILFSQTYERLKDIMMSDDKYIVRGRVVDIDIHCNNPNIINTNPYYVQIKQYYDEDMRFCHDVVEVIDSLKAQGYSLSYFTGELYSNCKKRMNGVQSIKDRLFSNVIIDIVIIEENMIQIGDKLSDRYGGKGVIVDILPDHLMPRLSNGKIMDIIFNKSTCINRLNAGQLFEVEINHIAQRIIEFMRTDILTTDECIDMYLRFLKYTSPEQYEFMNDFMNNSLKGDEINRKAFVDDLKSHDGIYLSMRPITDSFTLDKLDDLYQEFEFARQYEVDVPMRTSRGKMVYRRARRPIVCGTKYIYRLKQYAEEKFSVTSLSATNISNKNSRSKANKLHKGMHTKTPVRFGEMEAGNTGHMGTDYVIIDLLMYSASPHARQSAGIELLTGDPFHIDVKLDTDSVNTGVQELNTLLKTAGLKLGFYKEKIVRQSPFIRTPFRKPVVENPIPWRRAVVFNKNIDAQSFMNDPTLFDRMLESSLKYEGRRSPFVKYPFVKNLGQPMDFVPDNMIEILQEANNEDTEP